MRPAAPDSTKTARTTAWKPRLTARSVACRSLQERWSPPRPGPTKTARPLGHPYPRGSSQRVATVHRPVQRASVVLEPATAPSVPSIRVGALAIPRVLVLAIVAAIGARLAFWIVTDRIWEDALITVTHARNLVAGLGLTHHPGEPVTHGFTSALSVLIPLVGEAVVHGSGIFVLRVVSLVASVAALVFAYRIAGRLKLGTWPTVLVLAYLALDQNQIFYGMA